MRKRDPNRIEMGTPLSGSQRATQLEQRSACQRLIYLCPLLRIWSWEHRHPAGELYPPVPPAGFERRLCALRRARARCAADHGFAAGPGRRDGPGGGADRGGPAAGPGRTADNVTDGARPDWPGAVLPTVADSKRPRQRRGLLSCFFCLGPLRPLPAAAGTAAAGFGGRAAGSAVPDRLLRHPRGALWAGGGLGGLRRGRRRAAASALPGLDAALFSGRGGGGPPASPDAGGGASRASRCA